LKSVGLLLSFRGISLQCSAFITLRLFGLAHIHISAQVSTRARQPNLIARSFSRKSISLHLRIFSPVNCKAKAYGINVGELKQNLEKARELWFPRKINNKLRAFNCRSDGEEICWSKTETQKTGWARETLKQHKTRWV